MKTRISLYRLPEHKPVSNYLPEHCVWITHRTHFDTVNLFMRSTKDLLAFSSDSAILTLCSFTLGTIGRVLLVISLWFNSLSSLLYKDCERFCENTFFFYGNSFLEFLAPGEFTSSHGWPLSQYIVYCSFRVKCTMLVIIFFWNNFRLSKTGLKSRNNLQEYLKAV